MPLSFELFKRLPVPLVRDDVFAILHEHLEVVQVVVYRVGKAEPDAEQVN